jgi:two-component system NtrC family sensor kinase
MSNLRVVLREENQTPSVLGDSSQLLHVFLQIISNAMDALQEVGGGELLISISPCEPQVCIQFADSGPGIQHPQRVFEPFFTTKPVGQGTGLGLSTCYGIIRQHNGDISCGNRLEGGAFFTLFLPSSTAPLADPQDGNPVVLEKAQ